MFGRRFFKHDTGTFENNVKFVKTILIVLAADELYIIGERILLPVDVVEVGNGNAAW